MPSKPREDPYLATMDQIRDMAQDVKNIQRRLEALPNFTNAHDAIVTGALIKRLQTAVAELETAQAKKHVASFKTCT